MGSALRDLGDERLTAVTSYSVVRVDVVDELEFGDVETALRWINEHIPDGTEVRLVQPAGAKSTLVVGDVGESG